MKSKHSLVSKVALWASHLFGAVPLSVRRFLGRSIGLLSSYFFLSREKQITKLQAIRFIPDLYSSNFCQKIFAHFGQVAFENLNTAPIIKESKFTIRSDTNVTLEEIKGLSSGALALTAHFGNWDVLGGYFASIGVPLYTIGRRARSRVGQAILEKIRHDNGVTTLWRDDEHSAKEIVSLFKSGKLVAALIDQDTPVRSVFIDFFGTSVKTPNGIITLAKRFNRPIYISFIAQELDNSYSIFVERVPNELDEVDVLKLYHKQLEAVIRRYPHQWVWFHKRWRTANEQKRTLGTSEYLIWLRSQLQTFIPFLLPAVVALQLSGCSLFNQPLSLAKQAQIKAEEGKFDEAIDLYRQHFEARLGNISREDWENPHFYQMLIGDLELKRGDINKAIEAYMEGLKNGVDMPLFLDRIRSLADKLVENGELERALELLTKFVRDDPTLINESLDRISKKLLKR